MVNKKIHITTYKKISLICVFIVFIGIVVHYCLKYKFDSYNQSDVNHVYKSHYAFIADNIDDPFIYDIYASAKKMGDSYDIYVDSFTDSYTLDYTKADYLSIAIATKVDGIILVGEDNKTISSLVNKAVENKIPVVTIINDCVGSKRQSYIRMDSYSLGIEYGNLILDFSKGYTKFPLDVALLCKNTPEATEKTLLCNGIDKILSADSETKNHYNLKSISLDKENAFSSAEVARDLLISSDAPPDVIICLTEEDTLNVYATLIDLNKIDSVKLIGYYASTEILDAISRDLIYATFKPNTKDIGTNCLLTLKDYIETGKVTNETTIKTTDIISYNNVNNYIKHSLEENGRSE